MTFNSAQQFQARDYSLEQVHFTVAHIPLLKIADTNTENSSN